MECLGNLRSDAREQEERLQFRGLRVVVDLERLLDLVVGEGRGEGDEADVAGVFVDGDERALVEALDDVRDVLDGLHVDPRAALAAAAGCVGVGLDEDVRGRQFGAEDLDHLLDDLLGALLAELADEDAERCSVAVADAAHAVVAEGVRVAEGALPRDLAAQGLIALGLDGFDGLEDGNKCGDTMLLEEGDGFVLLFLFLLLIIFFNLLLLFRNRARFFEG